MTPHAASAVFLETPRLVLRRFADTLADAQLLFDLDSDPEVTRFTGPGHATADEYQAKIRNEFIARYGAHSARGFFAAIEKETNQFIGWFILRPAPDYRFAAQAGWTRSSDIEIGYRLRKTAWGRGLATEAATELVRLTLADLATTCVVAAALVPNRGSTRVMEKVGMSYVREFAVPGFAVPCAVYALCRPGCELP